MLLPAECKGDEVLLEMDTDCIYIEAEPKIARINDELCEINVRIRLGKETYAVYLKDDISYVYKIHTVDPDVVKSIIETI